MITVAASFEEIIKHLTGKSVPPNLPFDDPYAEISFPEFFTDFPPRHFPLLTTVSATFTLTADLTREVVFPAILNTPEQHLVLHPYPEYPCGDIDLLDYPTYEAYVAAVLACEAGYDAEVDAWNEIPVANRCEEVTETETFTASISSSTNWARQSEAKERQGEALEDDAFSISYTTRHSNSTEQPDGAPTPLIMTAGGSVVLTQLPFSAAGTWSAVTYTGRVADPESCDLQENTAPEMVSGTLAGTMEPRFEYLRSMEDEWFISFLQYSGVTIAAEGIIGASAGPATIPAELYKKAFQEAVHPLAGSPPSTPITVSGTADWMDIWPDPTDRETATGFTDGDFTVEWSLSIS